MAGKAVWLCGKSKGKALWGTRKNGLQVKTLASQRNASMEVTDVGKNEAGHLASEEVHVMAEESAGCI